jgi:hypothetical protein
VSASSPRARTSPGSYQSLQTPITRVLAMFIKPPRETTLLLAAGTPEYSSPLTGDGDSPGGEEGNNL